MYKEYSQFYDQVYEARQTPGFGIWVEDKTFWVEQAQRTGGPVLELGIGTGRLALPIARLGIVITGIDNSPEMLAKLSQKVLQESELVQQNLAWQLDSLEFMASIEQDRYRLAIAAAGVLQYLHNPEDQRRLFAIIYGSLQVGGEFLADVFNPNPKFVTNWGERIPIKEVIDSPNQGGRIRWYCIPQSYNPNTRIVSMPSQFEFYRNGKLEPTVVEFPAEYYAYTKEELEQLFLEAGFSNIETFRSNTKEPFIETSWRIIMRGKK